MSGVVHGFGIGIGQTGSKADLGHPTRGADATPELFAEGQGAQGL